MSTSEEVCQSFDASSEHEEDPEAVDEFEIPNDFWLRVSKFVHELGEVSDPQDMECLQMMKDHSVFLYQEQEKDSGYQTIEYQVPGRISASESENEGSDRSYQSWVINTELIHASSIKTVSDVPDKEHFWPKIRSKNPSPLFFFQT